MDLVITQELARAENQQGGQGPAPTETPVPGRPQSCQETPPRPLLTPPCLIQ